MAPWEKSAVASFSITVVLVSVTGAAAIAWAVMWILEDVTGTFVYWLVSRIILAVWWVACVIAVLTRVAIFASQKKKASESVPPEPVNSGVGTDPIEREP